MVMLATSYPLLNIFGVGFDSTVVIRWTGVAIATDGNGGASRCRNPGSHEVDVRVGFRTGGSRIRPQRATTCRQSANRGLGRPFYLVGVMTRAPRSRSIANHPLRCRSEAPPC